MKHLKRSEEMITSNHSIKDKAKLNESVVLRIELCLRKIKKSAYHIGESFESFTPTQIMRILTYLTLSLKIIPLIKPTKTGFK